MIPGLFLFLRGTRPIMSQQSASRLPALEDTGYPSRSDVLICCRGKSKGIRYPDIRENGGITFDVVSFHIKKLKHIEDKQHKPSSQNNEFQRRPIRNAEIFRRHGVDIFKSIKLLFDLALPTVQMKLL